MVNQIITDHVKATISIPILTTKGAATILYIIHILYTGLKISMESVHQNVNRNLVKTDKRENKIGEKNIVFC